MTCLKALREAAMIEVKPDTRYTLMGAADLLQAALGRLAKNPTLENMIEVNGVWAYAARVLKIATPTQDPSPGTPAVATQRRAA